MRELKGYFVPIFTPFNQDGSVDECAMRTNISYLIGEGIHGITLSGSFGEFPLLTFEERTRLYEIAVEEAAGRCAIVAGTALAATEATIRLSQAAESIGVDGVMIIAPYYLLPSERDLREHFTRVAESVQIPVTVYNNPPRTGVNLSVQFLVEISHLDNIVTIKQSSQNFFELEELVRRTQDQKGFHVTNGQEMWAFPALVMGAEAVYGVSPLVLGRECIAMYDLARNGEIERGRATQLKINRIRSVLQQCQATPAACVRELARLRGLAAGYSRLPITELRQEDKDRLKKVIEELGVKPVSTERVPV